MSSIETTPPTGANLNRPQPASKPKKAAAQAAGLGHDISSFTTQALRKASKLAQNVELGVLSPYLHLAGNYGAKVFLHPARIKDNITPARLGLSYQSLHFISDDGKTPLVGWYMPAASATDKTVILAHGFGGQQSDEVRRFAKFLHKAGYNVLSFDFRNSGGSGGSSNSIGYDERKDLKAAVDLARAKGAKHLAVLGRSMGGATAIEEAANDKRVNAVIADCSFDTLYDAVLPRTIKYGHIGPFHFGPFHIGPIKFPLPKLVSQAVVKQAEKTTGEPLSAVDPIKEIPKLADRPVFFIHGAKDSDTLPQDSKNLYHADPGKRKQLWIVPGATHQASYDTRPTEYQQKVLAFLKSALG